MKKLTKHAFNLIRVLVFVTIAGVCFNYAGMLFGAPIFNGFSIILQLIFNPTFMSYCLGGLFVFFGIKFLWYLHKGMKKLYNDLKKDYPADMPFSKEHQELLDQAYEN